MTMTSGVRISCDTPLIHSERAMSLRRSSARWERSISAVRFMLWASGASRPRSLTGVPMSVGRASTPSSMGRTDLYSRELAAT